MDKTEVKRVLSSYCPPLSPNQVDTIVKKLVTASSEEPAKELNDAIAKAAARRQKRSRKSRSRV